MDENNLSTSTPGKGAAIASLVLGIVSVVFWFTGMLAIIGLVCAIVGIICSSVSKKAGYEGGVRTAGLVLSIIGCAGCAIAFVACGLCAAAIAGTAGSLADLL